MTEAVDEDCPVCNASDGAREQFAVAMVAEHVWGKARRNGDHQAWIDKNAENGTLTGIREALADHGRSRN